VEFALAGARAFAFDYLTIFLFIAMAEELFFRGLLQNLLEGSLRSASWLKPALRSYSASPTFVMRRLRIGAT